MVRHDTTRHTHRVREIEIERGEILSICHRQLPIDSRCQTEPGTVGVTPQRLSAWRGEDRRWERERQGKLLERTVPDKIPPIKHVSHRALAGKACD